MSSIQEEKLIVQNTILQSTLESYRDVLIFSIDREYKYLVFNNAFKEATFHAYGVEVKEGLSMLESITNAEDRMKSKSNCDRALSGESHMTVEIYGDLERLYFETRYSPVVNEKHEIIGITVMSSNVTERKRAEEQLRQVNKELEFFSFSVSHDLRAPLRSINAYASILQEDFGGQLDDEGKKTIDSICRNAHKMGNLIDDLLTFSHLGRKDIMKGHVNMNELVHMVIDELEETNPHKKVQINIHALSSALGDSNLLKQVWINLISNALKYSGKKEHPKIEVGCTRMEQIITYYIKDNGVGFDMQYYDKLFGVFQRLHTDKEFKGTGIGLAIVQKVIQRHGGKVWAESVVNTGSQFFFTLPLSEDIE